jgi:hypothetical protein
MGLPTLMLSRYLHFARSGNVRSECRVRVEWKWGPYIPTGRASIGCDPLPTQPMDTTNVHFLREEVCNVYLFFNCLCYL